MKFEEAVEWVKKNTFEVGKVVEKSIVVPYGAMVDEDGLLSVRVYDMSGTYYFIKHPEHGFMVVQKYLGEVEFIPMDELDESVKAKFIQAVETIKSWYEQKNL